MRQRKANMRATPENTPSKAARTKLDQIFDDACKLVSEQGRRAAEAKRRKWQRLCRHRRTPKRELSQIHFASQHWWRADRYTKRRDETGLTIEEEKAAVWYEAARRRHEVQQAWRNGNFSFGANGWQCFTTWVVNNLPQPWPQLDPMARSGIIEASYSPWAVPPAGYSTFPETNPADKRDVSVQVLHLPETNDPHEAQRFVAHARRFADAGFLIVAVDKKQNQAVRAACKALEALPPTFRKADIKRVIMRFLPPAISEADMQAVMDKLKQGTFTVQDFRQLWNPYRQPTSKLFALWQVGEVQERVLYKRRRKGKLIEEKQFNFRSICQQLEAFDTKGVISEFVNAVRL